MSTFVLVHGSWHGAWCWYKVIPALEAAGHRVIAPDLPSLGRDTTPIPAITPRTWPDAIADILDAQIEPVVLVGHSRGGMVISQAAEARPDKVKSLVYLCAFLLRDGESLLEVAQAGTDAGPTTTGDLIIDEDAGSVSVRPEALESLFYGCCPEEDVTLARLLLRPEALAPLAAPIHVTPENYGRIPRVYIECQRDGIIAPQLQREMYARTPCTKVISMDTDHSPFFSQPAELAGHLCTLA